MLISVIIPAFNVEKTISRCVESIVQQKNTEMEIIIVNDGSKDNTLTVCEKLQEKYQHIKLISQINSGVSVARNEGVKHACGDWVLFVDGDDALQPNTLEAIDFNSKDDLLVFGYKNSLQVAPPPKEYLIVQDSATMLQKVILNKAGYPEFLKKVSVLDSVSCWTCWGKAFRRDLIVQNKIEFPEGITHGEDLIFNYRFCAVANRVSFLDLSVYYYQLSGDSVAHRFNPKRIENTDALLNTLEMESGVKESDDYSYFVYDRLYTCCRAYFGKENNLFSQTQKVDRLKAMCESELYIKSFSIKSINKLSIGKRTKIKKWYVFHLLKQRKYKKVIALFNGNSVLSRVFS